MKLWGGKTVTLDGANFHSKFGGMWIDRDDWRGILKEKRLSPPLTADIESFVADGFLILERAADLAEVDAFQGALERSFREGNSALLYQLPGEQVGKALDHPVSPLGARIVDSFAPMPAALDLFSSPRLIQFLAAIFGEDPLLFQSLSFHQGSEQGLHQDTAYVVVNRPMEMVACWIALEDVRPGSGELMYVPGSHRLPDWKFGEGRKHYNPAQDGLETHDQWAIRLQEFGAEKGVKRFMAKKGDILVWHADLAHGGSPVVDRDLTRQSLVGHFCPQSASPNYFGYNAARRTVKRHGRLAYSSEHYNLNKGG